MVRFPFFVRFGDRYALHGTPTDSEGEAIENEFVGSKIEIDTESAEKVFNFVEMGTPVLVTASSHPTPSDKQKEVRFSRNDLPATSALAYAVSDVESGEVLLVKGGDERYPIASITKLVTAAVATDVVGHGAYVTAPDGEVYTLSDLYYPLLLKSDNKVAERISAHVGTAYFMNNMNAYVRALGMQVSSFADTSGLSPKNLSSANDLVRFAHHLYREKSFLYDISKSDDMVITSESGKVWNVKNQNSLAKDPYFRGGKLGYTDEAGQTSLAVFDVPIHGKTRSVAVVVLRSKDWKQDTRTLLRWLVESAS
jgi:D-alanyl-D-alanine endopeptidase (penicillin-binding protein 7)